MTGPFEPSFDPSVFAAEVVLDPPALEPVVWDARARAALGSDGATAFGSERAPACAPVPPAAHAEPIRGGPRTARPTTAIAATVRPTNDNEKRVND